MAPKIKQLVYVYNLIHKDQGKCIEITEVPKTLKAMADIRTSKLRFQPVLQKIS